MAVKINLMAIAKDGTMPRAAYARSRIINMDLVLLFYCSMAIVS
jgi:hypothetical protein